MEYFFGVFLVIALHVVGIWRGNPCIFMIAAGLAIMLGLYSPDALSALNYKNFGVAVGLMLIVYSFVLLGFAYANLFSNPERRGQKDEE